MRKSKLADVDPESLLDPAPSSSSDDRSNADFSDIEDENAGREHYIAVSKSKLKKPAQVPLGPHYTGRGVSRKDLDDSDSDDPFARDFGGEDSEDHSNSVDEDASAHDHEAGSDNDEDDEEDIHQGSEDDDESEHDAKFPASAIRDLMKDTKSISSSLAASVQSDAAKGQAVKTQRNTFDSLLNTRIRLQKALISTNSIAAEPYQAHSISDASIAAAQTAALKLLNNLTDLRLSLDEARTGHKRKRAAFDSVTPSSEIWTHIQATETSTLAHRKAVLERWSNKTKATTVTNNKTRLNASAQQTLTEVLDAQLTSSHLITRTQIARSCAPLQASRNTALPDPAIYDDADFYGLLLKELLDQRSAHINANGTAEFVVQAPWQVAREAKTKKVVDTKASKGRRLRYTVQEKLQNFMAPEERGLWGDKQRDELFSSLFGQRFGLGEGEDEESAAENGVDPEEALLLFRS